MSKISGNTKCIAIKELNVFDSHLEILYEIDKQYYSLTKVYYPNQTLKKLATLYAPQALDTIYGHIALFEGLKFCLTFPETFDISKVAKGLNPAALQAYQEIATKAWSQHYFENSDIPRKDIKFLGIENLGKTHTNFSIHLNKTWLCANGGGKDSFLVMKIMEQAQLPYAMFQHARTEYGRFDLQHTLQERIMQHLPHVIRSHKISIQDDYTEGTLAALYHPELHGECLKGYPCQVGWPEMIFESLPFVLLEGYCGFVLGNERSAEASQAKLQNGAEVNHQWMKSNEAIKLINHYIQNHLIKDFSVISLLKPIYDYRIFHHLLKKFPEVLPSIHSCNVSKPWCKKCAKCSYVWMNLVAVFGQEAVNAVFQKNLFDDPDLMPYWRELLGLNEHNAFECVGEINEARLAFYHCLQQDCSGMAIDAFKPAILSRLPPQEVQKLVKFYNAIHADPEEHNIPEDILKRILPYL